ncbi:MAG: hypothetical protein Q7V62_16155, partial [Actinomycetota bacterium]|nr:hypothetical protein [Actinomycetota bacterium]
MEPFTEPSPTHSTLPSPPDPLPDDLTGDLAGADPFATPPLVAPFTPHTPVAGQLTAQWTQVFWIGWL